MPGELTRYSVGQQTRPPKQCVFCIYSCKSSDVDPESMAELEHKNLLDTVLRFWAANCATTEPEALSHLCVELATSLQASAGGAEGEDVVGAIDAAMIREHQTRHRNDREGHIAMLTPALYTASAAERVLSANLLVKGKHGKLTLDTGVAQQLRAIAATLASLTAAISKLRPAA